MDIANELKKIRETAGLSQQKMADLIGIPQKSWYNYESGRSIPKMDVLLALADKGYTIKGLTTGIMEDWPDDLKKKFERNLAIAKTGAFPLETQADDFVKIVQAVDDHPPPGKGNFGLVSELEKLIKNSLAVPGIESRLTAVEVALKELRVAKISPELEAEYPAETTGTDNYTAEAEPKYGEVPFYNKVAAGVPINQSKDKSMVVSVPLRFIKTKLSDYYAVRVHGNSMIDALIPDGSMVLIKKSDVPVNGKIQLVWIDGQATLKRMREGEDRSWTLCHEDGTGRIIPLKEDSHVQGDFAAVLPPNIKPYTRKD